MESHQVAPYVSLFWASLMIGRWTSAAGAFGIGPEARMKLNLVLPIIAFSIFLLVNFIAGSDVTIFYQYLFLVFVLIAADSISEGNPVRQLLLYSILGIAALVTGIFATGVISAYSFIAVGLFCSTLWPCIFTIAIHDLGKHTNEGASLLIMMIMGGGFVSLLQGYLADDALLGIQHSYWVGVVCFAYLAFYAWRMRGMKFTEVQAGGH
jgi:FHS family L-fucose permease-like MFS transporter